MTTLYEGAFAKLNLTLDVLGKREDGYHDIKSVMQAISRYRHRCPLEAGMHRRGHPHGRDEPGLEGGEGLLPGPAQGSWRHCHPHS